MDALPPGKKAGQMDVGTFRKRGTLNMATKTTKKKAASKKTTAKRKTTTAKKATAAVKKAKAKTPAKKTVAKKVVATKKASKKVVTTAVSDAFNKSQVLNHIAEETGLKRKEVSEVFDSLSNLMCRHLKKRAVGEFTVPGLMKCKVVRKPATKARKGINPFTGEETTFKAKPARNVVKVRPLKKLKEMAE
jgi:nucleoid DNA-binding protein